MADDSSDPFAKFATTYGLRISTEELAAFPRDVLAAPADSDRHVLVTVNSHRADSKQLRILFVTEAGDARGPSVRDVLWWLASDAWAIEHARHNYVDWAAMYRYADDDSAGMQRFKMHVRQARALADLLGEDAYASLLELYRAQVAHSV